MSHDELPKDGSADYGLKLNRAVLGVIIYIYIYLKVKLARFRA
jgi:hypothetical protein